MKINEEIRELLKECSLPIQDSIAYLIILYYNLSPSFIPNILVEKIRRTKIIENDKGSIKWNIPLFEEQITGFDWVKDWIDTFGNINKERRGSLPSVKNKMKKFFVDNPDIRKEEIVYATEMYLKTVDNPKYLKKSEKFIFEGVGLAKTSLLKEWVDRYRELKSVNEQRISKSVTMK